MILFKLIIELFFRIAVSSVLGTLDGRADVRTRRPRMWTDVTLRFSVDAELVEVKDRNVRLERRDGEIITVPVSNLSEADRDYLCREDVAAEAGRDLTAGCGGLVVLVLMLFVGFICSFLFCVASL